MRRKLVRYLPLALIASVEGFTFLAPYLLAVVFLDQLIHWRRLAATR
jgi:hypothetical protein